MSKSIDRRAASGATKDTAAADAAERARVAAVEENIEMRSGKARRLGPGARFIGQYFNEQNIRREVRRGELFGLIRMLAYHDREATWWRRAWGWLKAAVTMQEYVGPDDVWGKLADDFDERTMRPALEAMKERLRIQREAKLEEGRQIVAEATRPDRLVNDAEAEDSGKEGA